MTTLRQRLMRDGKLKGYRITETPTAYELIRWGDGKNRFTMVYDPDGTIRPGARFTQEEIYIGLRENAEAFTPGTIFFDSTRHSHCIVSNKSYYSTMHVKYRIHRLDKIDEGELQCYMTKNMNNLTTLEQPRE